MSTATELLIRAEECLRYAEYPNDYREEESDELRDDIRAFLAVEPEADEPVAWVEVKDTYEGPYEFHGLELLPPGKRYLYTRPEPARKPMTEEELDALIGKELVDELTARIYKWGFRDAEKHHGLTLQDKCRGDKE